MGQAIGGSGDEDFLCTTTVCDGARHRPCSKVRPVPFSGCLQHWQCNHKFCLAAAQLAAGPHPWLRLLTCLTAIPLLIAISHVLKHICHCLCPKWSQITCILAFPLYDHCNKTL